MLGEQQHNQPGKQQLGTCDQTSGLAILAKLLVSTSDQQKLLLANDGAMVSADARCHLVSRSYQRQGAVLQFIVARSTVIFFERKCVCGQILGAPNEISRNARRWVSIHRIE